VEGHERDGVYFEVFNRRPTRSGAPAAPAQVALASASRSIVDIRDLSQQAGDLDQPLVLLAGKTHYLLLVPGLYWWFIHGFSPVCFPGFAVNRF
jgi:hypothetical protein